MTDIKIKELVKTHGIACGGNWTAMLMSAIRNGLPEIWKKLDHNKEYEFTEVWDILKGA